MCHHYPVEYLGGQLGAIAPDSTFLEAVNFYFGKKNRQQQKNREEQEALKKYVRI